MTDDEATRFVISALSQHRNRNEIITTLCERMGLSWRAAEQLVIEVESDHGRAIAVRQSPLIVILGVGSIIVGLGLVGFSLLYFVSYFQRDGWGMLRGLRAAYFELGAFVTGIGMILGGTWGSWRTLWWLFRDRE